VGAPRCPRTDEPFERAGPCGTRVDRYVIERLVGRGGMGAVYQARHEVLGHRVAIKLLPALGASSVEAIARFEREARATAAIGDPHIVKVIDFGTTPDQRTFMVMELLEGRSLFTVIRRSAPLEPRRAVGLAVQILDALDAAHAAGVLHRDIKPGNVFVTDVPDRDGAVTEFVRLLDFGLSKFVTEERQIVLTRTGVLMGTPRYMSPEQVTDARSVDPRTDVYAVGVLLYEMLSGRVPHSGSDLEELLRSLATRDAPSVTTAAPGLPAPLASAVDRALARDPARRWPSARAFADALRAANPVARPANLALVVPAVVRTPQDDPTRPARPAAMPVAVRSNVSPRAPRRIAIAASLAAASIVAAGSWWVFSRDDADGPATVGGVRAPDGPSAPAVPRASTSPPSGSTSPPGGTTTIAVGQSVGVRNRASLDGALARITPALDACRVAQTPFRFTIVVGLGLTGSTLVRQETRWASTNPGLEACVRSALQSLGTVSGNGPGFLQLNISLPPR